MKPAARIPLAPLLAGATILALLTSPARSDVVMDWNIKADAIGIEKQLPNAANARAQAMLHVAMFEAVNAIENYKVRPFVTVGHFYKLREGNVRAKVLRKGKPLIDHPKFMRWS